MLQSPARASEFHLTLRVRNLIAVFFATVTVCIIVMGYALNGLLA